MKNLSLLLLLLTVFKTSAHAGGVSLTCGEVHPEVNKAQFTVISGNLRYALLVVAKQDAMAGEMLSLECKGEGISGLDWPFEYSSVKCNHGQKGYSVTLQMKEPSREFFAEIEFHNSDPSSHLIYLPCRFEQDPQIE
jgi:hypothetical protein